VREGAALLQGLASAASGSPSAYALLADETLLLVITAQAKDIVKARGVYCHHRRGIQIDQGVTDAFLKAVAPAAVEVTEQPIRQLEADHDAALGQWRLAVREGTLRG